MYRQIVIKRRDTERTSEREISNIKRRIRGKKAIYRRQKKGERKKKKVE